MSFFLCKYLGTSVRLKKTFAWCFDGRATGETCWQIQRGPYVNLSGMHASCNQLQHSCELSTHISGSQCCAIELDNAIPFPRLTHCFHG